MPLLRKGNGFLTAPTSPLLRNKELLVMIRKHNDKSDADGASGQGRTDGEGENFTKKYRQDPWTAEPNSKEREPYAGAYGTNDPGLRRKDDFQFRAATRDLWRDVNANDLKGGGPITAGVNRSQED
jgi:hypothetical protein